MTSTPHDALYKAIFEVAEHAAAELQHILPPAIAALINWPTLELRSGSYVNPELAARHSNLLFAAATVLGSPVLVYLLFEHQSSDDDTMPLRLLEAMVRVWSREVKQSPGRPLPVIIPAVLSHTPGGWKASTRLSGMFGSDLGALETYVPDFSYEVHLEKIRATLEGRAPTAERLTMTTIAERWRSEGKIEGKLEGKIEGKIEGKLEGKIESILVILDSRRIPLDEGQRARIEGCTDADRLDQWLRRAATAETADALFDA